MSRIIFAIAALAAAASTPAFASVPRDSATRIVSYADLDLRAPAGRASLDRRIGGAVRSICGDTASGDLRAAREARSCRIATLAQVTRPARFAAGTQ
jgi:UrcA family protein